MASNCKQCDEYLFGEDHRELAGSPGHYLCEGCGDIIEVDCDGKRIDGKWLAEKLVKAANYLEQSQ